MGFMMKPHMQYQYSKAQGNNDDMPQTPKHNRVCDTLFLELQDNERVSISML